MSEPSGRAAAPFIYRRRVRWGEADAARIAYTGKFPHFAMEALDDFFLEVLGENWYLNTVERNRGNPFVHLSLDFMSPLTPEDTVQIAVWIEKLGRSAITFWVEGHVPGAKSFTGRFVTVCVRYPENKSIDIPEDVRARAEAYQKACAGAPGPGAFALDENGAVITV